MSFNPGPAAYAAFAALLCFSHLLQGITGFGAVVLALPFLSMLFPLKLLIPAVIGVNLFQVAWFAVRERRHIQKAHALSLVGLSMLGLPVGWAVFRYLPGEQLKLALGGVVTAVALWNLLGLSGPRPLPRLFYHFLNFFGGVAAGSLACGGPFLVIYAARMIPDKTEFRATLSLTWVALNSVLTAANAVSGALNLDALFLVALALPFVALGTALGSRLHERIPQKPFQTLVFLILLVSGLVLLRPLLFS